MSSRTEDSDVIFNACANQGELRIVRASVKRTGRNTGDTMNLRDFGTAGLFSGLSGHFSALLPTRAKAATVGLLASTLFASQMALAATTTINTLLDTDNNTATGCSVSTLNGAVNGVESIVTTTVIADTSGYRTQSITMQNCVGGSFGAPAFITNIPSPIARGNGTGGTTAVESYVPHAFLPATGQPIRVAVTTAGSDGLTGGDALTVTGAGAPILVARAHRAASGGRNLAGAASRLGRHATGRRVDLRVVAVRSAHRRHHP